MDEQEFIDKMNSLIDEFGNGKQALEVVSLILGVTYWHVYGNAPSNLHAAQLISNTHAKFIEEMILLKRNKQ